MYSHHCDLYMDHEALKSLLNTPQPPSELARWGMAIQELDIQIHHQAGKHNSNAGALFRSPLPESGEATGTPCGVVAAVEFSGQGATQIWQRFCLLETGALPQDEKRAKLLALSRSQYCLEDGGLYYVESDGTLQVIPPEQSRKRLLTRLMSDPLGVICRIPRCSVFQPF